MLLTTFSLLDVYEIRNQQGQFNGITGLSSRLYRVGWPVQMLARASEIA